MVHVWQQAQCLLFLPFVVVFNGNWVIAAPGREFQILGDSEKITGADGEPIDLLVSSRAGKKQNDQRLFGTFSAAGRNYETSGDIVQQLFSA
ncbi:unnamed protein product [Thelazia callipaeda]|uniref:Secreted protein n=1 Tax=Thelazia callipaeda TaxID=103827 RepID=A0A0N5CQ82_THECL|nr:unnamed protein product [Thelazia callipaeda]